MSSIKGQNREMISSADQRGRIPCRRIGDGPDELILYLIETCTSTMDLAWVLTEEGRLPAWASVLAESQSSGRGQFRRSWYSPPGNLYGSVRLPALDPVWKDLVPLLMAEAMYSRLKDLGLAPAIKWPNDLLVAGKKVGGILVEQRQGLVIAGLGLNLASAPSLQELRPSPANPGGCLREFGLDLDPLELWISFIRGLRLRQKDVLADGNPEVFLRGLEPRLAYLGERVLLKTNGAPEQPGILKGIDIRGGLKIQTVEGDLVLRSGSISPLNCI